MIQENAFENVVWKMAAILPRPQCVIIYTGVTRISHQIRTQALAALSIELCSIRQDVRQSPHFHVRNFLMTKYLANGKIMNPRRLQLRKCYTSTDKK